MYEWAKGICRTDLKVLGGAGILPGLAHRLESLRHRTVYYYAKGD
jgi:hypothetical protein